MTDAATLTLLTLNIHRGLSPFFSRDVVSNVHALLESSGADLVCLQEVWQNHGLTEHQLEALTRATWAHRVYGRNALFPHGSLGNVLLSRFRIQHWENVDVTVHRFEKRGFLRSRVALPGTDQELAVYCVHLGLLEAERQEQAARLMAHIDTHESADTPVLVAGDFNDWRRRLTAPLREVGLEEAFLGSHGRHARTFPAFLPLLPLDRIYTRHCTVTQANLLWRWRFNSLSDHLPLLTTVRVNGAG